MLHAMTLFDIEGFDASRVSCRKFDVELTAYGSLIRRLALLDATPTRTSPSTYNLFDLVPFIDEINLVHSGPASITEPVGLVNSS